MAANERHDDSRVRALARELHARAAVADGHADSLMWNRDLNRLSSRGHVDFPRLLEAGVKIQCFTVVSRGLPLVDGFSLFARALRWPKEARISEWARTCFQLRRLETYCSASGGRVAVARSGADLEENLKAGRMSAVLGVEGGHALEGEVQRVRKLWDLGVRFMALTHLWNNELGGSSFPLAPRKNLTALGQKVLEEMAAVGMSVDLAHASDATTKAILSQTGFRIFCSHAGVRGVTPLWRNLSDQVLRAIADRGGVAGIIFAPPFLGGKTVEHLVRHIEHALAVMGEDAVGFGSDFDGLIPLPRGIRDARDLPKVTEALLRRGHRTRTVEKVIGGNFRRFFGETLDGVPIMASVNLKGT